MDGLGDLERPRRALVHRVCGEGVFEGLGQQRGWLGQEGSHQPELTRCSLGLGRGHRVKAVLGLVFWGRELWLRAKDTQGLGIGSQMSWAHWPVVVPQSRKVRGGHP